MIEIQSVDKIYGHDKTRTQALNDVNLNINQGEFVVILGKSGSGKSTLLSIIGGLEKPSRGNVQIKNNSLIEMSENSLAKMRRTELGFIFQHFYLMPAMTSLDNVELPLIISNQMNSSKRAWATDLLNKVGMENRLTHYPDELSGGERQRVGIARALVNKPTIIIADEPTGDLDSKKGKEIINLLVSLNNGDILDWKPTVILVTHDTSVIKKGMRVITLDDGMVISDYMKE